MDSAIGLMFSLIFLTAFCFGLAILYKNRSPVQKWLNTPYYAEDDRKLKLERRIADATKELEHLQGQEREGR